ncbi:MAG: AsmA-like C-terminal region-containing protein [bacterium]
MKRIFGFVFGAFRAIVWTVGLITIGVFCYFYVAERPVPRETLGRLLTRLSSETDALDARTASFGLRQGLVLKKVRLLPKGVVAPEWFTADELRLSGSFRPDRPPREWIDSVVAHRINLAMPPQRPAGSTASTTHAILQLPPMRFDLVDASFLGMRFKRLQGCIRQEKGAVLVENIKIEWPGDHFPEEATGTLRYDPATGLIEGQLAGRLLPDRITPLLRLLEANGVLDVAQRFVFNSKPVEVEARFRVAPAEPRYELRLTLAVADCTYSGVPITRANTVIVADGSNDLTRIAIQPLVCERPDGKLSGSLMIDTLASNVDFIAQSDMPVDPLLRLIRVNISPEKYGITFATPPRLTAAGRVPLDGNIDGVAFTGTLLAPTATVRRIPLQNLQCEFSMVTNTYLLRNIRATAAGGDVSGTLNLVIPSGDTTQNTYRTSLQVDHLDVETFAAQLGFTNRPTGKASAQLDLASSFGANHDRYLTGSGDVRIAAGVLGRIPLFAGLTDYMARNVPGIEFLVSQSEARMPFAISNGLLRSESLLVEGDIFSISGNGSYSFPADQLDFNVRSSVFKRRTWLGQIINVVTFPFSKLLLEFHVRGSVEKPVWEYHGVIERIVDTVGDAVGGRKDSAP